MKDPESFPQFPQATDALTGAPVDLLVHPVGGSGVVLVAGDLDLDSAQALYCAMREALDRSTDGLTVDLRGVGFCDCSGLNALLRIRHRALAQSKTIGIRGAGPQVARLLTATRTQPLFATAGPTRPGHRPDRASVFSA
ncbi:STAS domain-containing protein [Streptomyces sp. CBMA152]|uniref:STAS domain-containing protein n=1 Tax=Streptomyces sp. CBMA152 TaxID=1896312 RepID=UPI001660A855|nr:STAS domain-containing protein [Streptomyces sp. CBMA152]MBD0741500.1 hypothetical protein [Streptomyces sp. CBMA152]